MVAYNKNELELISKETGFIRDNLEKVIRLYSILNFIMTESHLKNQLILKGGTAINLTIFKIPRLSVDIDLDYCVNNDRDSMLIERGNIEQKIKGYMFLNGYSLHPASKNFHALDSWVFSYVNSGGNNDNIKIEINYMMRTHILKPEIRKTTIPFLQEIDINVMHPLELFGSKIKALIERAAVRDLYDVNNMIEHNLFQKYEYQILRKIVLFYLSVGGNSAPQHNYTFDKVKSIKFPQIRATLLPVLRKSEYFDYNNAKDKVVIFLENLLIFDSGEMEFINAFCEGEYKPELLFNDLDIIARLVRHPMALWKTNHIKNSFNNI